MLLEISGEITPERMNVRSMNQGKLEVVKQEMARVNIDILEISELKWTGMGEFNSDDHDIYYCGQESLRRNGVAIIVNKRVQNAVLGCSLKNDRMISVCFQGKPFSIIVIQVYAPISNAEEADVEWFYEDIQDLLELTPKKRYPFQYRRLECKSGLPWWLIWYSICLQCEETWVQSLGLERSGEGYGNLL